MIANSDCLANTFSGHTFGHFLATRLGQSRFAPMIASWQKLPLCYLKASLLTGRRSFCSFATSRRSVCPSVSGSHLCFGNPTLAHPAKPHSTCLTTFNLPSNYRKPRATSHFGQIASAPFSTMVVSHCHYSSLHIGTYFHYPISSKRKRLFFWVFTNTPKTKMRLF